MEESDEDFSEYDGILPTYNRHTFQQKLSEVLNLEDNEKKIQEYTEILKLSLSSIDIAELQSFVNHLLEDKVPVAVSKALLIRLAKELNELELESRKEIAHFTLAKIRMYWFNNLFHEQTASILRETLVSLYELEGNTSKVVQVEAGFDDSLLRATDEVYLEIATDLLKAEIEEDSIKWALELLKNSKDQLCFSKILEWRRTSALNRYRTLKMSIDSEDENECLQHLSDAFNYTILLPGPQKLTGLKELLQDSRSHQLTMYQIFNKMHLNEFLMKTETDALAEFLEKGFRSDLMPTIMFVLDRAMKEHNLSSNLFTMMEHNLPGNLFTSGTIISFDELGNLLSIHPKEAEDLVRDMILNGRIEAKIDEGDSTVIFGCSGGTTIYRKEGQNVYINFK